MNSETEDPFIIEEAKAAGVSTSQWQATTRERADAIMNSIQSVTKEIPPEDVDVTGASEAYKSKKTVEGLRIENELLCLAGSIGGIPNRKRQSR
ncbi:MAG: hypothetical protein O6826_08710 [Acidobacteria bacterium]|nr:hypothetical protein [Acidobacteriota bacterium]